MMDSRRRLDIKQEIHEIDSTSPTMNGRAVDYNKLYGDLCKKLLSTPVGEIFPSVISGTPSATHVTSNSGSIMTSQAAIHPAFPTFGAIPTTQMPFFPQLYGAGPLMSSQLAGNYILPPPDRMKPNFSPKEEEFKPKNSSKDEHSESFNNSISELETENMKHIDIQKLVDEFRITLERYGVSQRFAARFIMQDTSQGNLSFLMEKGRNKRWEELSPRGRLPYIKMKAWLESKEQQMMTLDMLKNSQDLRRSNTRESYSRRERFSIFQLNVLCRLFEENPNPPMNIRNAVAEQLDISLDRVNVWFQNQRARGFPARKVLQQSLYDGGYNPEMAIEIETMKRSIIEEGVSPSSVSPNSGYSETFCKKEPQSAISPPCAIAKKSPSSAHDVFPLDLSSAAKELTVPKFKPTINVKKEITDDDSEFNGDKHSINAPVDIKPNYQQNGNEIRFPTKCTNIATSGAAKRKRGCRPQQIIQTTKMEENTEHGTEEESPKRRKVTNDVSGGIGLNSPNDFGNNDCESKHTEASINEYQYVLKSEPNSPALKSKHPDPIMLIRSGSEGSVPKIGPSTGIEITSSVKSETSARELKYEKLAMSVDAVPQNIDIFKAICVNLATKSGGNLERKGINSKETFLKEPDLD